MGSNAGSIMATIMTTHMPRNVAVAPAQDCPGMRIQAMDMVQPPGISMPGMSDMEPHQATVTAALATKTSAAMKINARSDASSLGGVFIVALPPEPVLVATQGRAVQPLVHVPEVIEPARVGGIRVIDLAILFDEGAHAGAIPSVGGRIRAHTLGDLRDHGVHVDDLVHGMRVA